MGRIFSTFSLAPANDARARLGTWLRALLLLFSLAAWQVPVSARADESKPALLSDAISVVPGATCLEGLTLTEHVREWLGSNKLDRRIHVRVIGSKKSSTRAVFILDKEDGYPSERKFEAAPESCVELHRALGLSIAMAIKAVRFDAPLREPSAPSAGLKRVAAVFQWYFTTGIVNPAFAAIAPVGLSGRFDLGWMSWLDVRVGIITSSAYGQRVQPGAKWKYDANLWAVRGDICYGADPLENLRSRLCLGSSYGLLKTEGINQVSKDRFFGNAQDEEWAAFLVSGDLAYSPFELFGMRMGPVVELLFPLPLWTRRYQVTNPNGSVAAESVPIFFGIGAGVGWVIRAR